ncbi:MAG: hypothetical protein JRJ59_07485 [Deltaproteobacteria bacterium]|nr:hypothetical protein [Deltaproteobacteria bacterium]
MNLSRIVKAGSPATEDVRSLDLPDLSQPVPSHKPKGSNFKLAEYFKAGAGPKEKSFERSFVSESQEEQPEGVETPLSEKGKDHLSPEEIVAKALAEAEAIKQKAQEEGRQAGYEAGREESLEAISQAVERIMAAAGQIESSRDRILAEVEAELVDLVVMAASKVVGHEIKTNPQVVVSLVKTALKQVSQSRWVKIEVNPQDLKLIEEIRPQLLADNPDLGKVELGPNPEISPGGCLVMTESEEIEDTVEARLANLSQAMDRVLKGAANGS